jgi:chorismate mutase/prephenate dehydrogenase
MTDDREEMLARLRAEIAAVDDELLALVARRLLLARQVGEAKRAAGLPVRSFGTEAEVLARFRARAETVGLDEPLVERLAHYLISASVRLQEETPTAAPDRPVAVLIVGGAGKMGRWLARYFQAQGHHVATLDPAGAVPGCESARDLAAALPLADVVVVATPLSRGAEVLHQILAARPRGLVVDILSLKSHVIEQLKGAAARGLRVASLHPLFGPDVRTLGGRVLAVLDCGNAAAADEAAALFADSALTITRLPIEAHDVYMQYVLGLSHLAAILFFTTLARSGRPFDELAQAASTTFLKQARTAAEVARESPALYYEIQKLNRHSKRLFALVKECLGELEKAALADRADAFVRLMETGRSYFPDTLPVELE